MLPGEFVIIGTIIASIGGISYFVDTIRGRIKPNRVSFFLWSLAPLVAFFAQIKEGVGIQSLLTLYVGLMPLLIFIATFVNKDSEWKLTKFDLACGALSLLGFVLYLITKEGVIAIAFSIFADGLAGVPTIVKSYKYPETENAWPWLVGAIGGGMTLLTITTWSFISFGFPLYITLFTLLLYILLQFKIGKKFSKR